MSNTTGKAKHLFFWGGMSALLAIWIAVSPSPATAQNPNPGSAPVNVVGPLPLPVTGSLNVANLPNPMPVNGSVSVSNLPNPLPVTGSVSVSNLPDQLSVSGTVAISGAPTVQVVTPEPVHWSGECRSSSNGGCSVSLSDQYRVPFGRRLVVEYVSFRAINLPPGLLAHASIFTGTGAHIMIPPLPVPSSYVVIGGQTVRFYGGSGDFIGVGFSPMGASPPFASDAIYQVHFIGYLE
jgi:hypothetical protein